jgi:hypothetical protein
VVVDVVTGEVAADRCRVILVDLDRVELGEQATIARAGKQGNTDRAVDTCGSDMDVAGEERLALRVDADPVRSGRPVTKDLVAEVAPPRIGKTQRSRGSEPATSPRER